MTGTHFGLCYGRSGALYDYQFALQTVPLFTLIGGSPDPVYVQPNFTVPPVLQLTPIPLSTAPVSGVNILSASLFWLPVAGALVLWALPN